MTIIAQDTFTRANQSGWGTASGGGSWTLQVSSPTLSIASNEGKSTGLSGNDWLAYLGSTSTDFDIYVRCTVSDFGNDGVGIYARYVDASNWYRVFIYGTSLAVDKKAAGTFTGTVASSAFSPVNNTFYWVRVNLISTTLKAKVWSGTLGSEPGTWAITTTMSGVSGTGHAGIGAYHNASGDISQFDNFTATDGSSITNSAQSVTETVAFSETATVAVATKSSETIVFSETVSGISISAQSVTEKTIFSETVSGLSISTPIPGAPGGVRLLINDVWYPKIRQETINIDRTANDPISTFKFTLQDDGSGVGISELQEVIFLDAGQIPNPTHNLLRNPLISAYTTIWTQNTTTGGTFTQASPGVQLTASNAVGTFGLSQSTQNGLVMPGQSYMLSCYVQSSGLTNIAPFLTISYLAPNGSSLGTQSLTLPTNTVNTRYTLEAQAPAGTATAQISFALSPTSGTNSGSSTFSNIQFEPMSFATGPTAQYYPTDFCGPSQANCFTLPDATVIRQYRLFGGIVTKATAGRYIGNNRQWMITVSSYAWLFQKQLLNDTFTNRTDQSIIVSLVTKYFANQFSTAQVTQGATLDMFGYNYNGTFRDAMDALASNANYNYYVDAYRTLYYQPPGWKQVGFALSDQPDNVTSFPYYAYSLDIDGTQLGNAILVTGGTNISVIEYDGQSIGYYNQKTNGQGIFWRTVNDSTIASNAAAQQRAIAELTEYNYARQVIHLTTQQMMIPGQTVLFSSRTDTITTTPYLIQKSTLTLIGFMSQGTATYECACDLGAFNPDFVNITVKLLRKQLTNTSNIGTPVIGLMATEETTFLDTIRLTQIAGGSPTTYGMGTYGTSVYAASVPSVPTTRYGVGTWGDSTKGYA